MSTHYELFETTMGPVVMFQDEVIVLHEYVRLFDVIDENPHFLSDLKGFISEGIQKHSSMAVDAFNGPTHMVALDYLQGYLNAVRVYAILANQEYPRYRHAQQEALKHV